MAKETQNLFSSDEGTLLKQLVKHSASATSKVLAASEQSTYEVVFESDIDGTHYYLVRCKPAAPSVHLSPREMAIARLIARGLPNKGISESLDISCWTVNTHLRRIFSKLGVNSRAAMVAKLKEANLL